MVTVVIVVALVFELRAYREAGDSLSDHHRVMEMEHLLHDVSILEWRAIGGRDLTEIKPSLDEYVASIDLLSSDLKDLTLTADLLEVVPAFLEGVMIEFQAIVEGRWEDAEQIDEEVVDPLFEQVGAEARIVVTALMDRVERARIASRTLSIVSLLVVGLTVLLLAVKFSRYRALRSTMDHKDRFLATLSHELRTPLTGVVGMASVLQDQWDELEEPDKRGLVDDVAQQGTELGFLIEDLLVLARHDPTSVFTEVGVVDAVECVREVWHGLPLETVATIHSAGHVVAAWADPLRVRQILRNLATNAVRYGGPNITVDVSTFGNTTSISVIDDGPGIPTGMRDKVFDAYHHESGPAATPEKIGLGLTVSRQLARLMGGDVTYDHRDGRSIFTLSLPSASSPHLLSA